MAAGVYNFSIEQGTTFRRVLTLRDADGNLINLTSHTARMQIRQEIESTQVMLSLTTSNGRITLGGVNGTVTLFISDADTAALSSDGVYDLEIVSGSGEVTRILKGKVRLDQEVTRA